jgi:hypothetical protein
MEWMYKETAACHQTSIAQETAIITLQQEIA